MGERVPLSPSGWLTPSVVGPAAAGIGGAVTSPIWVVLLKTLPGFDVVEHRDVILPVLLLGALLASVALAAPSTAAAVLRCVLGAPVAGALGGLLSWLVVESAVFAQDSSGLLLSARELPKEVSLPLQSAMFGIPIGVAFGVVLLWPIAVASTTLGKRTHDAPDRALVAVGVWLVLMGAVSLHGLRKTCCDAIGWEALALGGVLVAVGRLRLFARKRWLARVRRGLVPNWSIKRWEPLHGLALEPLVGDGFDYDGVLTHIGPPSDQPYRKLQSETGFGLVPRND